MIPISKPIIPKNAKKKLLECLKSGWISGAGPIVVSFEREFARFVGTKYAVSCTSGTTALHLALAALGIGPGDEVIVPTFTMISTILPVIYVGATPVLVDSEADTGNIDVSLIESKITKKTKAVMPVHLYGHPVDMEPLLKLVEKNRLAIIEDAAEAHGAQYQLKKVGSIGDLGCFSFYANKIVTSGEGGMVTTNDKRLAEKLKSLRNLARTPKKHFYHQEVGFNYRLSSLQAALGLASLEEVTTILKQKRHIASLYRKLLSLLPHVILPVEKNYASSVFWHYAIVIKKTSPKSRNQLAEMLAKKDVETRTFHIPMHIQPALVNLGLFKGERYPNAEFLSKNGLLLPSGPNISDRQIATVCSLIQKFMS
ncbi:DegT/DnrJ/EryC1/StrS family aminotransferase [Candidatus Microgenomates bacterium]|nr:DegT/DnrJ/EryC1/StrS family aminotransferase [Candidatus Microgenomates bacterium]